MVSAALYKRFGVSNAEIGWYTSLLGLAWVVKPLWGPLVDLYGSKRSWVLATQGLMAVGLLVAAGFLPTHAWWVGSLAVFAVMSFASATHDIAADGYYMLGLDPHRQALFNGIRSTFWRLSMIIGTGVLVIIAGVLESRTGPSPQVFEVSAKPNNVAEFARAPGKPSGGDFVVLSPDSFSLDAGSTAALSVTLPRKPDTDTSTVLNISPQYAKWYMFFLPLGNAPFVKVTGADRLEFGPDTWDKPQTVVVSVDNGIHAPVVANFKVTAGNIPYSWMVCIGVVGVVYFLIWLYHMFAMPRPEHDRQKGGDRPPFIRAAFWLLLAVGIPAAIYWGLFEAIKPQLVKLIPGDLPARRIKNLGDVMSFVTMAIIVGGAILAFRIGSLRSISARGFQSAARKSGLPFDEVFMSFFRKPAILRMIAFLLLYRLADAMLVKMIPPFMLDPHELGGLGLSTTQFGLAYGTIGVLGLLLGGIAGSVYAATYGLMKTRLVMCLFMNVPIMLFVLLALNQPSFLVICGSVFVEQFGYGFGFSMYMLYMLFIAGQGEHKTSHYALCTGFMALSFMLPGMISGIAQEMLGYLAFYLTVLGLASMSFVSIYIIPIDPEFGRKKKAAH
jgi:PAT family beta-lactamase induction signal transducer AmpG